MPNECDLIVFSGDIDLTRLEELQTVVEGFQDSDAKHVVVDLSDVTYFGSEAVNCVSRLCNIALRRDGTVTLINATDADIRVMDVSGLSDRILQERHYAPVASGVPAPRLASPAEAAEPSRPMPGVICFSRVGRAYGRVPG